ncbi:MAG: hypothetical protein JXA96_16115, partial [Sedimentisphaerales bacterium]|nr:hypothetical protein [Sedimentisphaerales bacterium]
ILGNEAFINNKWYKEGDMVQDAKIVSIEPTQVTIEWDGKKTVLRPLGANVASNGTSGNAPPRPENIITSGRRAVSIVPPAQGQPPDETPSPDVVIMEPPSQDQMPDEIKNAMEQMNLPNMSPEMLQNMSEEQRKQFEQMIMRRMEMN